MPQQQPPPSSQQQWPRGPENDLHKAALFGSNARIRALLASSMIDVNLGDPNGWTPLMCAAHQGHSTAARILLSNGANVSPEGDGDSTALLFAAENGHAAVTKILLDTGAADPVAARACDGSTPLHLAAAGGHSEVMRALIEAGAGASSNSRRLDGATPLYLSAESGHLGATKILLRAGADPTLPAAVKTSWKTFVPLDEAAGNGHTEVVRELLQRFGLKGCGGASGGIDALSMAARHTQVDTMEMLTDAGLIDNGEALIIAASFGRFVSAKFLLKKWRGCRTRGEEQDEEAYANGFNKFKVGPLLNAVGLLGYPAPRIVRMLVDAGANTESTLRLTDKGGKVIVDGTPLAFAEYHLREKKVQGRDATEEHLHRLQAVRRLLLRVEAIHAVSWLWRSDGAPSIGHAAEVATSETKTASAPLISVLSPVAWRKPKKHGVLLAALFRWVVV